MTALELERNYRLVEGRIAKACDESGRERSGVLLVVASKMQPAQVLMELYELGVRDFGENKVQELLTKREQLPEDIRWHFIGHLQSNKSRQVAPFIHLVHSIDSFETGMELSKRAQQHNRSIGALIEVNISREETKHGVETGDAESLVRALAEHCTGLELRGLMGMASYEEEPQRTRPQFEVLDRLRDAIQERHPELKSFTELSMGMTNDFEVAIEEGATMIRVGSALFGERTY